MRLFGPPPHVSAGFGMHRMIRRKDRRFAARAGSRSAGQMEAQVTVHSIPEGTDVRTDPGYAADPGHAGTGEVVATLC
jgi:hypothetical protein